MPTINCKICKKEKYWRPSIIRRGWGKYCSKDCHNQSMRKPINKTGRPVAKSWSPETEFWSKVIKKDGCWEWKGRLLKGYGAVSKSTGYTTAHRLSYELHKGKIPKGMLVLHSCDNPPCTNPEHLQIGTYSENTYQMYQRKRGGNANNKGYFKCYNRWRIDLIRSGKRIRMSFKTELEAINKVSELNNKHYGW